MEKINLTLKTPKGKRILHAISGTVTRANKEARLFDVKVSRGHLANQTIECWIAKDVVEKVPVPEVGEKVFYVCDIIGDDELTDTYSVIRPLCLEDFIK